MHTNEMFYALLWIDNHIIICLSFMLSHLFLSDIKFSRYTKRVERERDITLSLLFFSYFLNQRDRKYGSQFFLKEYGSQSWDAASPILLKIIKIMKIFNYFKKVIS